MPKDYIISGGDCFNSLAFERGFFWETLWNHPKNAELKSKRRNPNILKEGDVVHIPDSTLKEETSATGKRHRFERKGVPAKLRLRIMEEPVPSTGPPAASSTAPTHRSGGSFLDNVVSAVKQAVPVLGARNLRESITEDPVPDATAHPDKPRANIPYIIEIDGKASSGQTDADGRIEQSIPPNARRGRLILEPGTLHEVELPLNLGHLNPLTDGDGLPDVSGTKHRLANLGFDCGDRSNETTPGLTGALRAFQEKHGLQVTGQVDQTTCDKISQLHGS